MARSENAQERLLVLYDGLCGLCDGTVQFCLRHDREGVLTFSPLQGETAARYLGRDETIIVIREHSTNTPSLIYKSDAVLAILHELGGVWRMISCLRVIPSRIRDPLYDVVAKHRSRWFGKLESCRIPSPEVAGRFLP